MYLHIGNGQTVRTRDIIGVFDMDNTTVSKRSREFLNTAQRKNNLTVCGPELPKSFLVCAENKNDNKVYLTVLSSTTLLKRINKGLENEE